MNTTHTVSVKKKTATHTEIVHARGGEGGLRNVRLQTFSQKFFTEVLFKKKKKVNKKKVSQKIAIERAERIKEQGKNKGGRRMWKDRH